VSIDDTLRLFDGARAGDAGALNALFARHAERLEGYLRRSANDVVRGDADLDDVLQCTVAKAFELQRNFRPAGPGAYYGWLCAIANNVVRDRRKYLQAKGRDDVERMASDPALVVGRSPVADSVTSVPSRAARDEERRRIQALMAKLDAREREVLELHYYLGLSFSEIATRLGVSKATAFERVERALSDLARSAGAPNERRGS
jgi:RNA polymerase sigma-70 factor, ECF subfamily